MEGLNGYFWIDGLRWVGMDRWPAGQLATIERFRPGTAMGYFPSFLIFSFKYSYYRSIYR